MIGVTADDPFTLAASMIAAGGGADRLLRIHTANHHGDCAVCRVRNHAVRWPCTLAALARLAQTVQAQNSSELRGTS